MRSNILLVALLVLINSPAAFAQAARMRSPRQTDPVANGFGKDGLQLINSAEYPLVDAGMRQLINERETIISELIKILGGNEPLERRMAAARVLGDFRATQAVDTLIAQLKAEREIQVVTSSVLSEEEFEARFQPVTTALKKIGTPAAVALTQRLASLNDGALAREYVGICLKIDGPEMLEFRLKNAIKSDRDEKHISHYQTDLHILEFLKSGRPIISADDGPTP